MSRIRRARSTVRGATAALAVSCIVWASNESTAQAQPPPGTPDCTLVQVRTKFDQKVAPEFRGCDASEANRNLNSLNQKADIKPTSAPPPVGIVVTQDPLPGAPWPSDSVFDLWFADGKPLAQVGNVTVSVSLQTQRPYLSGQSVQYVIVVGDPGGSESLSVSVDMRSANLEAITVSGGCTALPCQTTLVPSNGDMSIIVGARIVAAGDFANEVSISSTPADQNRADNVARVVATATEPTTPPPPRADIAVTVSEKYGLRHQEGESLDYTIVVSNRGPDPATRVSVDVVWENLSPTEVAGECKSFPCTIDDIAPNASVEINVRTRLGPPGPFRGEVRAQVQTDPNSADNVVVFDGVIVATPLPWLWVSLAVSAVIVLGAATQILRRAHWRRLVEVNPLPGRDITPSKEPLTLAAPRLEVRAWLEMGEAYPTGPIPSRRRKV